ncbi:FAD-binding domain-containing protein [Conidiobolus coronatus NRRL 28638]|uniref:FAD-binding domain-containing protein n=1 Tax=Conidiobolus coronatus (strain ATCC 28846 / CBS 209.66 / NRRL 28638) TaxID=796925 RepID=A0A137P8C5_CONC2|nr:FAD-binding domain-containing protein [Conidiobolus coronatus NRRL 28638]|eukprot:KXN71232.1 FAD-binding domain-containing protein [Conidiobolus coronatus NRRL 28638]
MFSLKCLVFVIALTLAVYGKTASEEKQIKKFENCLRIDLPKATILTEGEEYEAANYQWNLRNPIIPLGIFSVVDKNEIQIAVKCSTMTNVSIVAKSGGHSYEKYSFGTGKEIIIDLHKMDKITVDAITQTATVQAGALLGHVYYQLFHQGGFSVPAGSCLTVGISGHTLGGGYGLSARKHGLMSDNLLQAEITLPSGQTVIASKSSHSDLFWALRGAGAGNFGIVSEFKFKLFKPPSTLTRIHYHYSLDKSEEAFKAFQKWAASSPDPSITTVANFGKNGFNINSLIQPDSEEHRTKLLEQLKKEFPLSYDNNDVRFDYDFIGMIRDFGDPSETKEDQLDKLVHSMYPQKYFRAKSAYVDKELSDSEIKEWKKVVEEGSQHWLVLFDMQGGALDNFSRNETAFVHRHKPLYSIQLIGEYRGKELIEINEAWGETYFDRIKNFLSDESFQNYIDAKAGNSYHKYYAENFDRLQKVKQMYDPKNKFNFKQSIPLPDESDQEL